MSLLAIPENSQLLLIDPVPKYLGEFEDTLSEKIVQQFRLLSLAADAARVPRYFVVSSAGRRRDNWLSTPCEQNKPRVFAVEPGRAVWTNEQLLKAMRQEMRAQLFVCGFWLDDVVSATALEALALGFNAHLITDLTPAMDRANQKPAIDRLNQYGVPPISLRALLYEWAANSNDAVTQKELMLHWEAQKDIERRGASA
ncbi:MAG: isochorismatase family protein [Roseitalea sp.]|jgi:hypothetical protein|nr:isochorismatase family protein [Roseitalea sp.]MBO6745278.1 isochorismatase family protein [Roseitalea sp.]